MHVAHAGEQGLVRHPQGCQGLRTHEFKQKARAVWHCSRLLLLLPRDLAAISANALLPQPINGWLTCGESFLCFLHRLDPDDPSIKGRSWEAVEKAGASSRCFLECG